MLYQLPAKQLELPAVLPKKRPQDQAQDRASRPHLGRCLCPFKGQDLREILRQRVRCLQAGFPLNHPIIITLDEIRDQYVKQVGVAAYFKQMVAATSLVRTGIPGQEAALDFTNTEQVQRMLKVRAYCLKMGILRNDPTLVSFQQSQAEYIGSIGPTRYLAQMLGPLADVPAEHCTFFQMSRPQLLIDFVGDKEQPLLSFIHKYFRRRSLYLKVEICHGEDGCQMKIRYL